MSLLEKVPLEVLWYDIFQPLDLGSLFSLYEALPDRYAHLRDLLSCRIQEEIYNAIMEANKEMKVLVRKAACFETHLSDIREKILGYREPVGAGHYTSDLIRDASLAHPYSVQPYLDSKRKRVQFCYENRGIPWNVRLREPELALPASEMPGTVAAELHFLFNESSRVIFHYRRRENEQWLPTLHIEKIVGQCGTKTWTYSDKNKALLEQVGIHRVQICVETGDLKSDLTLNFNKTWIGRRRLRKRLRQMNPADWGLPLRLVLVSFCELWIPERYREHGNPLMRDEVQNLDHRFMQI